MNLRQTYEQLIANKLKQLPAPDANASWQQMKQLLDDEEDRGAGGRKRPSGGGWWRIGILAIVFFASVWLYEKNKVPEKALSKNNAATSPQAGNKTGEANNTNSSNNQTDIIEKTTTLPGSNTTNDAVNNAAASNTMAGNKPIAATVTKSNTSEAGANPDVSANTRKNNSGTTARNMAHGSGMLFAKRTDRTLTLHNTPVKTDIYENALSINNKGVYKVGKHHPALNNALAVGVTNSHASGNRKGYLRSRGYATNKKADDDPSGITAAENTGSHIQYAAPPVNESEKNIAAAEKKTGAEHKNEAGYIAGKRTRTIKHPPSGKTNSLTFEDAEQPGTTFNDNNNDSSTTGSHYSTVRQPVAAQEKLGFERLAELKTISLAPAFNTSLITDATIEDSLDVNNLLNNETKKSVVKAKRDKEIEDATRREKRSFHLNLSNVFKPFSLHLDAEPRWAAGIGLNNGITLNAQSKFNYSINAKSGTLSDYIPSLYLQFHLNEYVYMQTELNFISPQYTPQLLLYQSSNDISVQAAGMSQQKSIYARKLYYFNLPVSLHYSPINNFYFSAGLQFSSFQSGLAAIEQKQYQTALGPEHASSTSTSILKFKDDSIAAQIAPNEWRWQVGADYYWNRFSVGLRYNQSFKNAINTVVLPASPATKFRNESLLFFVRYNLFESRKKGSGDQKN